MRPGNLVAVAVASRKRPVRGVLEERRRDELESGLVLRKVNDRALAREATALERGEDRDHPVADRDVVDVRPVEDHRSASALAEQLVEAGERRELAPIARVLRVWSGLSLIAAREDDQVGARAQKGVV